MKKNYESPVMEIEKFDVEDVITVSLASDDKLLESDNVDWNDYYNN